MTVFIDWLTANWLALITAFIAVIALGFNIETRLAARRAARDKADEAGRYERLKQKMERNPEVRFEVLNLKPHSGRTVAILVRNRSEITTILSNPVFGINGYESQVPGNRTQFEELDPGETHVFYTDFLEIDVSTVKPEDCKIIDVGYPAV